MRDSLKSEQFCEDDYGFSNDFPTLSRIFDGEDFEKSRKLPESVEYAAGQDWREKARPLPQVSSTNYLLDFPPKNAAFNRFVTKYINFSYKKTLRDMTRGKGGDENENILV